MGLLVIQLYVAARVTIALLFAFSGDNALALFAPSPFWSKVLFHSYRVALPSFAGNFVGPIPIWFLVSFRRGDWERIQKTMEIRSQSRKKQRSVSKDKTSTET